MRHIAVAIFIATGGIACSGDGATETEPPATETGRFILRAIDAESVPAYVTYCTPGCSGRRLVHADTFEVEIGETYRFRWAVSYKNDGEEAVNRIVVVGTLVAGGTGAYLTAENHPVVPPSIYAGFFFQDPTNGGFELRASPPWPSSGGSPHFRYERVP